MTVESWWKALSFEERREVGADYGLDNRESRLEWWELSGSARGKLGYHWKKYVKEEL